MEFTFNNILSHINTVFVLRTKAKGYSGTDANELAKEHARSVSVAQPFDYIARGSSALPSRQTNKIQMKTHPHINVIAILPRAIPGLSVSVNLNMTWQLIAGFN